MKKFILAVVLVILPGLLFAEENAVVQRPHWSIAIKGGRFVPDIANWSEFYVRRDTGEYGGSLAYKITRYLEAGIEGDFIRAGGKGLAPLHSDQAGSTVFAGHVTYRLYPLNVFVLARAIFTENQWVVPYIGGGWTRMFYREEVEGQGVARGYADGYHARGGIQILLDNIDPSAANSFYLDVGVHHTYLFLEAERTHAMADTISSGSVNIGGTSWLGGLLFEF